MELIKAKEILILNVNEVGKKMPADTLTALTIGISAITRVATMRSYAIPQSLLPLKGETSRSGVPFTEEQLSKLRESPLGKEPKPTYHGQAID
ncbi:unnamed protein product [marine sediment metagenome]|uniref:Uncharacterized protein n=1 Tax=marine sediment metagenome TaxID=412755 RepID=X1FUD7_9ZZZZ